LSGRTFRPTIFSGPEFQQHPIPTQPKPFFSFAAIIPDFAGVANCNVFIYFLDSLFEWTFNFGSNNIQRLGLFLSFTIPTVWNYNRLIPESLPSVDQLLYVRLRESSQISQSQQDIAPSISHSNFISGYETIPSVTGMTDFSF
jgi:hypothetical protein